MSEIVTDPTDPRICRGAADVEPVDQCEVYLVLSEEERKKGYVRPVRRSYVHKTCGTSTKMSEEIAETYARDPKFYGSTYCCQCRMHKPVNEFTWLDNPDQEVGS